MGELCKWPPRVRVGLNAMETWREARLVPFVLGLFGVLIGETASRCSEPRSSGVTLEASHLRCAVFQRDERNQAFVAIRGQANQPIGKVEARATPRRGFAGHETDWQPIVEKTVIGKFSGAFAATGGWYDVDVRAFDEQGRCVAEQTIERVGVGEVFLTAGQSNSVNAGESRTTPRDERVNAFDWAKKEWRRAADPQPVGGQFPHAAGQGGSPWPAMGDKLASVLDVPIGLLSTGAGGSSIDDWSTSADYQAGENYSTSPSLFQTNLKPALEALQRQGGLRAILFHQGETDSMNGVSAVKYRTSLRKLIALSREQAGYRGPWVVAIASYYRYSKTADGTDMRNDEANERQIAAAQRQVVNSDPMVFCGPNTNELGEDDRSLEKYPPNFSQKVHFNAKGIERHGRLWADALLEQAIVATKIPERHGTAGSQQLKVVRPQ